MRIGSRGCFAAVGLAVAGLAVATAAYAHHSFAMFDQSKQLSLKGTVREFQWTNPHAWIHLDVPGTDGTKETWQVELNSPNNLKRQGWKATSVKAGDQVILVLNPLKDGSKGGLFVSVTLPDGSVLGDPTRARGGPINVPVAH
ncbi:MAG: hypothetical protein JWM63_2004 [Gammaproteobacteria bacterium]|jgi:hypothetical protein|nr:hypothetical protein [Gammaproteobacteria bacterium]